MSVWLDNQNPSNQNPSNNTTVIVNQSSWNWVWVAWFVLALIWLFIWWIPVLWWLIWFLWLILSFIGIFKKPRWFAIAWLIITFIDLIILSVIFGWLISVFSH